MKTLMIALAALVSASAFASETGLTAAQARPTSSAKPIASSPARPLTSAAKLIPPPPSSRATATRSPSAARLRHRRRRRRRQNLFRVRRRVQPGTRRPVLPGRRRPLQIRNQVKNMKKNTLILLALSLTVSSAFAGEPVHRYTCSNGNTDTIYKLNVQSETEVYYEAGNTNVGFFEAGIYAELDNSVPHNDLMSPLKPGALLPRRRQSPLRPGVTPHRSKGPDQSRRLRRLPDRHLRLRKRVSAHLR